MGRLAWIAPLLALGIAACGSMSDDERFSLTTPGTDDMVVREIAGARKRPPAQADARARCGSSAGGPTRCAPGT